MNIGDKLRINKDKNGRYIGTISDDPSVGNIIGNNEYSWKSGTPSIGDKLIINRDSKNRLFARMSGNEYPAICPGIACPLTKTIISTIAVSSQTSYNAWPYTASIYASNGWDRDSDHGIVNGSYISALFSPQVQFTPILDGTVSYVLSITPSPPGSNPWDDIDISIYLNGNRTELKHSATLGKYYGSFDITSLLISGENTIQVFAKIWSDPLWPYFVGWYFPLCDIYVYDETANSAKCWSLVADYIPSNDYRESVFNHRGPDKEIVSISGTANQPAGYNNMVVYINDVLVPSANYSNVNSYLITGNNKVKIINPTTDTHIIPLGLIQFKRTCI